MDASARKEKIDEVVTTSGIQLEDIVSHLYKSCVSVLYDENWQQKVSVHVISSSRLLTDNGRGGSS